MSLKFGICLRLCVFLKFCIVLRLFLILVFAGGKKKEMKLYNVRNVSEYLVIYWMHTQYEQEQ
jgi:hypothetical protein